MACRRRWECQQRGLAGRDLVSAGTPSPLVSLVRGGMVLMVGFEEQIECLVVGQGVLFGLLILPSHLLCSPVTHVLLPFAA